MPQRLASKFAEFTFSQEELKQAKEFTYTTRCWLQNELTNAMLRKVALIYRPEAEMDWKLYHAELDGRISLLAELLDIEPVKPKENSNAPDA